MPLHTCHPLFALRWPATSTSASARAIRVAGATCTTLRHWPAFRWTSSTPSTRSRLAPPSQAATRRWTARRCRPTRRGRAASISPARSSTFSRWGLGVEFGFGAGVGGRRAAGSPCPPGPTPPPPPPPFSPCPTLHAPPAPPSPPRPHPRPHLGACPQVVPTSYTTRANHTVWSSSVRGGGWGGGVGEGGEVRPWARAKVARPRREPTLLCPPPSPRAVLGDRARAPPRPHPRRPPWRLLLL